MPIVVVGHVDHGKSTIVGRVLADTGSLPDGKLAQVRELCVRTSKPFEYAFLLDALKDERDQGITIDAARVFFKSAARSYVIIDAPGHVEFLKNMVTGAARAEAALLVVDAREGVQENSRRHASMLALLGVGQVAVLVNKLDLVAWSQPVFDAVVAEMQAFMTRVGLRPTAFVPVSGREGANLVKRDERTPWYEGPTVLDVLDGFAALPPPAAAPFRMPVQDVYRFSNFGDDRRIVAGSVETGIVHVGDDLVFYPSGKRARVRSIEAFNRPTVLEAQPGEAAGLTLDPQIYTTRGELAVRADEPAPLVSTRLRVSLFWLGRAPLVTGKDYLFRLGTARVPMQVERVEQVLDASTLATAERAAVAQNEVADCVLTLGRPVAVDRHADLVATGRFVVVDNFEIRGGGIVREVLPDADDDARRRVVVRNLKWEHSLIAPARRETRFAQRPTLLFVTGDRGRDRKGLAKALEERLFAAGRNVYFLGMGNMLYGIDADLDRSGASRQEHFRRLGEIANLMLDAGMLLIVSVAELEAGDVFVVGRSVALERILTVWVGEVTPRAPDCDLVVSDTTRDSGAVMAVEALLRDRGVILEAPGR